MDYNSPSLVNSTGNHYSSQISPIDVSNSSITQTAQNTNINITNNTSANNLSAYSSSKLNPNSVTPTSCGQNISAEPTCLGELSYSSPASNPNIKIENSNFIPSPVVKSVTSNFGSHGYHNLTPTPSFYSNYHNSNQSGSNYNIYTNGLNSNSTYNLGSAPSNYLPGNETNPQSYSKSASYDFGSAGAYVSSDLLYPSNTILHEYFFPNNNPQYYSYPSTANNGHAQQAYPTNVLSNYMARGGTNPGSQTHAPTAAVNINVSCNIAGNGPTSMSPEEHSSSQTTPHGGNHSEHTTSPVAKYNTHTSPVYDYIDDMKQSNFANICNNNPMYPGTIPHETSPEAVGYPSGLHMVESDYMKTVPGSQETRKLGIQGGHLLGSEGKLGSEMVVTHHPHVANATISNAAANHVAHAANGTAAVPPFSWMKIRRNQSHNLCKFI